MQLSWLLRYSLLIVAATRKALTYSHEVKPSIEEMVFTVLSQNPPSKEFVLHEVVTPGVIEKRIEAEKLLISVTSPMNDPAEREQPALRMPRSTATSPSRKRQDDGQIQALSAQLQLISQSATQAISSVSSSASSILSQMSQSAQSVRQSADQAAQSASQAADQASRQLFQTQLSASSAVSAANARASDQLSQSLASMSSRISANQASAESSASNAISSARVAASQFAASQIQAAKAGASGVSGDANSEANQTQSNSVSASNVAIITVVSIIGTAILSTLSSYFLLRYRHRKRSAAREEALASKKKYEKPVAVRGSLSPRFPRFGGSLRSSMNDFRLLGPSPLIQPKKTQREAQYNIGSAVSDYRDQEENRGATRPARDVDSIQPTTFRLQKSNGVVSSATAVRLIRVGSEKSKADSSMDAQQTATEPIPPPPMITAQDQSSKITSISTLNEPTTQFPSQSNAIITQPPKAIVSPVEEGRASVRSTRYPGTETPGWRPPTLLTKPTQNRFTFRDSSDMESGEPTPANLDVTSPLPNPNTLGLRAQRPSYLQGQANNGSGDLNKTASLGRPKNAGGTFATFPRIRSGPERGSMMNRGRPNLNGRASRIRGEEESR